MCTSPVSEILAIFHEKEVSPAADVMFSNTIDFPAGPVIVASTVAFDKGWPVFKSETLRRTVCNLPLAMGSISDLTTANNFFIFADGIMTELCELTLLVFWIVL